jgi:tRNA(Arg) A34 adenosine deaminase TadA
VRPVGVLTRVRSRRFPAQQPTATASPTARHPPPRSRPRSPAWSRVQAASRAAWQAEFVTVDALEEWARLPVGAARSLELAHRALIDGGLPVGSAIVDDVEALIAEGRNRAYDTATGTDPLERTPIAHAEMNAMANLDVDTPTATLTLWSTQQPCLMCRAATAFIGIGTVLAVATDPSAPHDRVDEVLDDIWVVLATTMFLTGPFRRRGRLHPTVQANLTLEPESVTLAELIAAGSHPLVERRPLTDTLDQAWNQLHEAAQQRLNASHPDSAIPHARTQCLPTQ